MKLSPKEVKHISINTTKELLLPRCIVWLYPNSVRGIRSYPRIIVAMNITLYFWRDIRGILLLYCRGYNTFVII